MLTEELLEEGYTEVRLTAFSRSNTAIFLDKICFILELLGVINAEIMIHNAIVPATF